MRRYSRGCRCLAKLRKPAKLNLSYPCFSQETNHLTKAEKGRGIPLHRPLLPLWYIVANSTSLFFLSPDLVNIFKLFIPQLLSYPNPTDPLNGEAAALLMRDPKAYENRIRECVRLHASNPVHLDGTPVAVVPPAIANTNTNANATAGSGASSSGADTAAASSSSGSGSGSDESDVSSSSDEQPAVSSSANAADGANGNSSAAVDKEGGEEDATMGEAPAAAGETAGEGDAKRRAAAPGNNDAADGGASSSRSSSGSEFMMEVGHFASRRRQTGPHANRFFG